MTINPAANFDPDKDYAIQVDATAIDDAAGTASRGIGNEHGLELQHRHSAAAGIDLFRGFREPRCGRQCRGRRHQQDPARQWKLGGRQPGLRREPARNHRQGRRRLQRPGPEHAGLRLPLHEFRAHHRGGCAGNPRPGGDLHHFLRRGAGRWTQRRHALPRGVRGLQSR